MSARRRSAEPPRFELVVIVASLGGLRPVSALLAGLPASFPVPLLVMQHRHHDERRDALAWLLSGRTVLPVRSACDGMSMGRPGVTVIPPGAAATVEADGYLRLQPRTGRAVPERSDGDGLLASAARASAEGSVIGVVLSGRMRDGSEGIRAVKRRGGWGLAQDPATSQARNMPASAIATGCVDFVLPPERMAAALISLAMAPGGAQLLTVPLPHWAKLGA
jgi:two-component system chemotaxis response regulator CheB